MAALGPLTRGQQIGSAGLYVLVAALCVATFQLVIFTAGAGSHGMTVLSRIVGS